MSTLPSSPLSISVGSFDLPDRPEPAFEHRGSSPVVRSTVSEAVTVLAPPTFGSGIARVSFLPDTGDRPRYVRTDGREIPLDIPNLSLGAHNIQVHDPESPAKAKILEHVLAITVATGMRFNLALEGADNYPTLDDGIASHFALLRDKTVPMPGVDRVFTVREPVMLRFASGAYVALYPDDGRRVFTVDTMVSYPDANIGTQRAVADMGPEAFEPISRSRTNAFGLRQKLLHILDRFPWMANAVGMNFSHANVFAFDRERLINPKPEFFSADGSYLELILHSLLDKAGAFGVNMPEDARFVGRAVFSRTSHAHDVEVLRAMSDGRIPLEFAR
jgi:hypothetical protein